MPNPVVHFEIVGQDAKRLQDFYSEIFGWQIRVNEATGYGIVKAQEGKGIGGGILASGDSPFRITVYIQVDDLQAYLDRVEALGGRTIHPVTAMPGSITYALFEDPDGHVIGLVKG